jgi:hypothetical protein
VLDPDPVAWVSFVLAGPGYDDREPMLLPLVAAAS